MGLVTSLSKLGSLTVVTDAEVFVLGTVSLLNLLIVATPGNPGTLGDILRVDSLEGMEAHKPVVPAKTRDGVVWVSVSE